MKKEQLINIIKANQNNNFHETDWYDFKRKWQTTKFDLFIDILNFANTVHDKDCYLILGINDNNGKIIGINDTDPNIRSQNDLNDLLKDHHFLGSTIPKISLNKFIMDTSDLSANCFEDSNKTSARIDVITIFNSYETPFILQDDFKYSNKSKGIALRAGVVYARIGDTNTNRDSTASDQQIESLWKKRLHLDKSINDRYKYILTDVKHWEITAEPDVKYYYLLDPRFVIDISDAPLHGCDHIASFALNPIDGYNYLQFYEAKICYDGLILQRLKYVVDTHTQLKIFLPDHIFYYVNGRNYICNYYLTNSLEFLLTRLMYKKLKTQMSSLSLKAEQRFQDLKINTLLFNNIHEKNLFMQKHNVLSEKQLINIKQYIHNHFNFVYESICQDTPKANKTDLSNQVKHELYIAGTTFVLQKEYHYERN